MKKINNSTKVQEILQHLEHWTRYKKGLCQDCEGSCCYMPVEITSDDLIRLGILSEFDRELSLNEQNKKALKHQAIKRYTPSSQKYTLSRIEPLNNDTKTLHDNQAALLRSDR